MSDTSKINLKELRKSFGRKAVLNGVDLDIQRGESLVVIGGSGSGKSVLLKCILGLITPDKGSSVTIDGRETTRLGVHERDDLMRKFGMLFQGGALFDSLSIWENVAFAPLQHKLMSRRKARDLAVEKLESVGLSADIADQYPAEMSGGMQKRISLARAIALNPEIIFFDEPTTGLDPIMADVINDLIVKCTAELGSTTISITHDMASARKIGHRIAMLYRGTIIWHGNVDQIDRSNNDYVDQFIHGRAEGPITQEART